MQTHVKKILNDMFIFNHNSLIKFVIKTNIITSEIKLKICTCTRFNIIFITNINIGSVSLKGHMEY